MVYRTDVSDLGESMGDNPEENPGDSAENTLGDTSGNTPEDPHGEPQETLQGTPQEAPGGQFGGLFQGQLWVSFKDGLEPLVLPPGLIRSNLHLYL